MASNFNEVAEELVFQGLKPLSDARSEIFSSNLRVQCVLPAAGFQFGMFGECSFDPSNLLMTAPLPEELETKFINIGDRAAGLQISKLERHLKKGMLTREDIHA